MANAMRPITDVEARQALSRHAELYTMLYDRTAIAEATLERMRRRLASANSAVIGLSRIRAGLQPLTDDEAGNLYNTFSPDGISKTQLKRKYRGHFIEFQDLEDVGVTNRRFLPLALIKFLNGKSSFLVLDQDETITGVPMGHVTLLLRKERDTPDGRVVTFEYFNSNGVKSQEEADILREFLTNVKMEGLVVERPDLLEYDEFVCPLQSMGTCARFVEHRIQNQDLSKDEYVKLFDGMSDRQRDVEVIHSTLGRMNERQIIGRLTDEMNDYETTIFRPLESQLAYMTRQATDATNAIRSGVPRTEALRDIADAIPTLEIAINFALPLRPVSFGDYQIPVSVVGARYVPMFEPLDTSRRAPFPSKMSRPTGEIAQASASSAPAPVASASASSSSSASAPVLTTEAEVPSLRTSVQQVADILEGDLDDVELGDLSASGKRRMKGKGVPKEKLFYESALKAYDKKAPNVLNGFKKVYDGITLDAYVNEMEKTVMVALRGTFDSTDLKADVSLPLNKLRETQRYRRDAMELQQIVKRYSPSRYEYYVSGHSLGGAVAMLLKRDYPFIRYGVGYNSAYQPQDVAREDPAVKKIYTNQDPLYQLGGRLFRNIQVIPSVDNAGSVIINYLKGAVGNSGMLSSLVGLADTALRGYTGHSMETFGRLYR